MVKETNTTKLRWVAIFLLTLFLSCFLISCSRDREGTYPYRLELFAPIATEEIPKRIRFVDIDGDGADEKIFFWNKSPKAGMKPSGFAIFDLLNGRHIRDEINIKGIFLGLQCLEIGNGAPKEIVCFELEKSSHIFLTVYDLKNYTPNVLIRLPITGIPLPEPPSEIETLHLDPILCYDWNQDNNLDLFVRVFTPRAYQPRGLWIFDLKSGKVLLKKQVGPGISPNIQLFDVDRDGKSEILFGSSAYNNCIKFPLNKRVVNGTDDSQSWIFIIDDSGEFLLKKPLGDVASDACIAAGYLSKNMPRIIILKCERQRFKQSAIAFLDPLTGKTIKFRQRSKVLIDNLLFFDWKEDGEVEFITIWGDGLLEVRNYLNEVVGHFQTPFVGDITLKKIDFNQDGSQEIAIFGSSGLMILNAKLKPQLFYSHPILCFQTINQKFGKPLLFKIALRTNKQAGLYRIINNPKHFFFAPPVNIITFFVGIVISVFVGIILRSHQRRQEIKFITQSRNTAVLIIDNYGNIINFNPLGASLIEASLPLKSDISISKAFSNPIWKPIVEKIMQSLRQKHILEQENMTIAHQGIQRHLLINLFPLHKGLFLPSWWVIQFIEITELIQSKRALAWAGMAQRLAHEMKTPLSSLMLAAQQLQMIADKKSITDPKFKEYLSYIIDQVYRLRTTTDAFMKFARLSKPQFQSGNINLIIEQCLDNLKNLIPLTVQIKKDLQPDLPYTLFDEEEIAIAIKNILENSLKAIQGRGILTISTRLEQFLHLDKQNIVIEINDTGCGISPSQLNQIFEPFFSKFEDGTGLGLTMVKQIIDDHRGTIKLKSEVGIGTTVIVSLPVEFNES